jgi:hypothetical protein
MHLCACINLTCTLHNQGHDYVDYCADITSWFEFQTNKLRQSYFYSYNFMTCRGNIQFYLLFKASANSKETRLRNSQVISLRDYFSDLLQNCGTWLPSHWPAIAFTFPLALPTQSSWRSPFWYLHPWLGLCFSALQRRTLSRCTNIQKPQRHFIKPLIISLTINHIK